MSLYDLASTVFAAHKVVLHEHFRCVPAIIAYSNRFYGNTLQPLRVSKQSERIDPPLVDIYVPSGNAIKKINLTFILFITDTIAGVGKQFNII